MTEEKPKVLWFNGNVVPWQSATIHVWSEVAIRGTNVFEGIRAYWESGSRTYRVVSVDEHLQRLMESAKILRFG
ncbi:MAG: branched-chain-amino-acid transaminase, partial [Candidatus Eisenbacteria bacterium]